jgi:hypothetical protein
MTNKSKRVATAWLLGLPSFGILASAAWCYFVTVGGAPNFQKRDILFLTWTSAQFGLSYRAFETRDDFDSPPWLAYFFSYQIRLLPASLLITTASALLLSIAKMPEYLTLGISGPLAFLFGREPKLGDLLKILDFRRS